MGECNCRKCQGERYEAPQKEAFRKQMGWSGTDEIAAFMVVFAVIVVGVLAIAVGFFFAGPL